MWRECERMLELENHHFDMKPRVSKERDPNPKDLATGGMSD